MLTGDVRTFYQARRVLMIAACVLPVVLLAGVWWLVTQVMLIPGVPDENTPPDHVAQFIMHEKGLPRLKGDRSETFLLQQIRRLARDAAFRERFLAEVRTAGPDDQKAFRENLFNTFMPLMMRDVRHYHELEEPARQTFLDERIVAYNRMKAFVGSVHIDKNAWGAAAPSANEILNWIMTKMTEEERQRATAYIAALQARVDEILADPALKADFEARVAAP